jgi:hypothetical protein
VALRRTAIVACLSVAIVSATAAARKNKGKTTMAESSSHTTKQLASNRPIGRIEPVFEFLRCHAHRRHCAADGRTFVNFRR